MIQNQIIYLKKYLIKGTIGSFLLKIASTVLSLGISILLARLLGAEGYGVYAYVMALIGILSIPASLGLPNLIVREIAKYNAHSKWGLMRGLLLLTNRAILLISILLMLIVGSFSLIFMEKIDYNNIITFWLALFLLPLISLNAVCQATLRGLHHVILGQFSESIIKPSLYIMLLGISYILFYNKMSPFIAMVIQIAVYSVAFGFSVLWVFRYLPNQAKITKVSYDTPVWVRSAIPFLFLGGMQVINTSTDIVMLGLFRSAEEVGVYRVVTSGAQLVTFVLLAVNMALAPTIAKLYSIGDMQRLQRTITVSTRVILLISLPIALVLIFFGQQLLYWLFGGEFELGASALAILCVGQLVNASMGSVGVILNMTGYERDSARGVAIGAGVNIVLNSTFIPVWGIEGAACATAISMIVWNILLVIWVYKRLGIHSTVLGRL